MQGAVIVRMYIESSSWNTKATAVSTHFRFHYLWRTLNIGSNLYKILDRHTHGDELVAVKFQSIETLKEPPVYSSKPAGIK